MMNTKPGPISPAQLARPNDELPSSSTKATKQDLIDEINRRVSDKILEQSNADLLIKLINRADSLDEAISIATLGTVYKRTGLHFAPKLEKKSDTIKYFKKNEALSFHTDDSKPVHKLIIGDNYPALQNLLIQYQGKVEVIYIDPPYGKDSMGEFAKTNYDNAITRDNLLSMLYPRLQLAKMLLSDSGVIFCSIDDKNQAYVKCLFDEVFGEENFVNNFLWLKGKGKKDKNTRTLEEYILCYAKNKDDLPRWIAYKKTAGKLANPDNDSRGEWFSGSISYTEERSNKNRETYFTIKSPSGVEWTRQWLVDSKEEMDELIRNNKIYFGEPPEYNKVPRLKIFENDYSEVIPENVLSDFGTTKSASNQVKMIVKIDELEKITPKPSELLRRIFDISSFKDSIILDFFAGSGTTGHAVIDLNKQDGGNRTFILCQLNEITDTTPNGIAYDVTAKRLKRIMTGECYDGSKDFPWLKDNTPYGGNLDVYEIGTVANFESTEGKTPFDVIDEKLYGKEKFRTVKEKIDWVCQNFDKTQKYIEGE